MTTPPLIHPTAIISPKAQIHPSVKVGAYSIVEDGVVLSERVEVGAFCHIYPGVHIEEGVQIFDSVQIGGEPQDLKYRGEETLTRIGANTVLREFVTIHRGTKARGATIVGKNCLLMAYVHVAHDSLLGNSIQIANGVQLGGHVYVGSYTVIGGMTGVHQFTAIGAGAYVAGGVRVARDILPFSKALGEPLTWGGLNRPALSKLGVLPQDQEKMDSIYKQFRHHKNWNFVVNELRKNQDSAHAVLVELEMFLKNSQRPQLHP